jgi:hypothetical protein
MRFVSVLCLLLLLCGFAAAQVAVMGGTASNWVPPYGVYAAPFVPLITTPSVTLSTVSPSPVGASNATWGLVAGATNATLSEEFIAPPPVGVNTIPVWYGPTRRENVPQPWQYSEMMHRGHGPEMGPTPMMHGEHMQKEHAFEFIAGPSAGSVSVASVAHGGKASRTYTNQDIDTMNQKTGTVHYDGKTEKL